MTDKDIMSELLAFTEADEHTKFQLLQTSHEYFFTCKVKHSIKLLIKYLNSITNRCLKDYCATIVTGTSDVTKLLVYKRLCKIIDFYSVELSIVDDMLVEYESYLFSGNWLDFILGTPRPSDKLWDHRG